MIRVAENLGHNRDDLIFKLGPLSLVEEGVRSI